MAKSLVPMPTYTYYRGQKITLTLLPKKAIVFYAAAKVAIAKKYRPLHWLYKVQKCYILQVLKLQKS